MAARVTQRVVVDEVADLVTRAPRAAIAFAGDDGPQILPVALRVDGEMMSLGVDRGAVPEGGLPSQVTLVSDDGRFWFELRAVVWRGVAASAPEAGGTTDEERLTWYRFEPRRVAAWDYSRLHEVHDEEPG